MAELVPPYDYDKTPEPEEDEDEEERAYTAEYYAYTAAGDEDDEEDENDENNENTEGDSDDGGDGEDEEDDDEESLYPLPPPTWPPGLTAEDKFDYLEDMEYQLEEYRIALRKAVKEGIYDSYEEDPTIALLENEIEKLYEMEMEDDPVERRELAFKRQTMTKKMADLDLDKEMTAEARESDEQARRLFKENEIDKYDDFVWLLQQKEKKEREHCAAQGIEYKKKPRPTGHKPTTYGLPPASLNERSSTTKKRKAGQELDSDLGEGFEDGGRKVKKVRGKKRLML